MAKILVVSSQIHQSLSVQQLDLCRARLDMSHHEHHVEMLAAGTYEIPFVINAYAASKRYDAFIALGLVLKTNLDHFDYIMSHIKHCFSQFALNGVIVGNGIISGQTVNELAAKIISDDPCSAAHISACNAVVALLSVQAKLAT